MIVISKNQDKAMGYHPLRTKIEVFERSVKYDEYHPVTFDICMNGEIMGRYANKISATHQLIKIVDTYSRGERKCQLC